MHFHNSRRSTTPIKNITSPTEHHTIIRVPEITINCSIPFLVVYKRSTKIANSEMTIHAILLINAFVVSVFSLAANSLLVYLIHNKTTSQLKSFSRLMLMHCFSDVFLMFDHVIVGAVRALEGVEWRLILVILLKLDRQ